MFFTMVVSLYTSRVVLEVLGVEDFGIYNIIGGVVVLFTFLTNALTNSTQRYLNYNVGLNDIISTKKVFCVSMQAHFVISVIVLLLAETLGLWLVNNKLNIPHERMYATCWVYQLSVLVTIINIMRIPYNAVVIAYEKMSFFAYVTILETVLKLLIVYALFINDTFDKLILYSILLNVTALIIWYVYRGYCRKYYEVSKYTNVKSYDLFKELISFTTWYLYGGLAMVASRQGINIILNIFFNVMVNAAVGVANQVKSAVYGFVSSFQTAFNPQIVKLYANKDFDALSILIIRSSKFSFYLMLFLSLPIIFCCEDILSIWLVDVPKYAVTFTQLTIITTLFDAVSAPLWTLIGATGNIKRYQIIVSCIIFIDIPLSYILLKSGLEPYYVFISNIIVNMIAYIFRYIYTRKQINLSLKNYSLKVFFPCLIITLFSILSSYVLTMAFPNMWIITFIFTALSILIFVYIGGLDNQERKYLIRVLFKRVHEK